ncbi:HAD family hydrolase [Thalassotalea litorea]|uniref:HAD family hydrolase n=1 Tax=Thalassotalea litorea TaxID=2020715 RepID=UPI003736841C
MVEFSTFDVVVFDLDDTLYSEIDYVLSGYRYLSQLIEKLYSKSTYQSFLDALERNKSDIFEYVIAQHKLPKSLKEHLVLAYRYHTPNIQLHEGVIYTLEHLKSKNVPVYLITDGRGLTQRLKIVSLGIEKFFDYIFISEEVGAAKPEPDSFLAIQKIHPNKSIVYVADNPKKDFIVPKQLGWGAIGILNKSSRVHPLTKNYRQTANVWFDEFKELTC